jgi:hypothetical protein
MKRGDISRLHLLLLLILILGIRVSMDLRRATDRRRLDVTPHRVRWGIDTAVCGRTTRINPAQVR